MRFLWGVLVLGYLNMGVSINYRLSQPQIYVDDGHLYFVPAEHRNLVLISNGTGKIIFNDVELEKIVVGMKNLTREQMNMRRVMGNPSNTSMGGVARRLRRLEHQVGQLDMIETIEGRVTGLERQLISINGSAWDSDGTDRSSRRGFSSRVLRRRIVRLERRVRDMSARNPCARSPCQNSGSCIPTIFGPYCLCPSGWEGNRCQIDVNECTAFAGSGLGCQNGAQCVNTPGSYQCNCRGGWMGVHCTLRSGDCSSAPSWELCGHGICVNQHTGSRPYTCICEQGWRTDGTNPSCTVDVDECNGPHPSCSLDPYVACLNIPGSFHCGPCPPGYTGNGYRCTDINECLQNNGGCSTNPYVQCINTIGSRTCSECPPGYLGNGVTCQYVGICQVNNGGCHAVARCIQNPALGQSYVQCICPPGYTGSGMGSHGCFPVSGGGGGTEVGPVSPSRNPCASSPCSHGTCVPNGSSFVCSCQSGFTGPTCSLRLDPCLSSPCQNNGTCAASPSGFVCRCPNDFTGLRCETQEQSCGGVIRNVEGTLRYPHDSSQTYRHSVNCMWTLRTEVGKVLNLTFTRFHMEGGGSCTFDWLQIHDGADSRSPLIGKFCGNELPMGGSLASTHDAVFLWFRSNHSAAGLGFEFDWNSTDAVCGETISGLTHGSINSPGYPGNYPHNRDCLWTISVSLSKRIQLVFATLRLENHPNCSFDYLEVRDGLEETAPVLGMYCYTTLPPPLVSSGPHFRLLLHTDGSAADTGFHVTFAEVPGVPGCGGVFSESKGVFSSPQHPEPYPHGLDCEYLIRIPGPDERITVTFTEFELESGRNCRFDFVEIRDGSRPDSPLIGRFCERNRPPVIRSASNVLLVRFRSDSSVTFGGFRAKYESVCGGTFSTPSGVLHSPYYPQPYPKNRDCIYVIAQPLSKAIRLDFTQFDIEGSTPRSCAFDFLEIRDGDTANSTLIGHFCGPSQSKPDPIVSTFNYLWLRFKTDGSIQNRGFLGNYSTFDVSCGGIMRESHGIISSPGHPEVYPHGVDCTWIIRGVPGQVIRLSWVTFSLEQNSRCAYDSVEIYDNSTLVSNNGSLIGRYCGQDPPPQVTSSDYIMTIRFKSDHSVAHDGFMANYVLLNSTTVCGANYFTETGVIRSPGYPANYPPSKTCVWTINVPTGKQIMLNITEFDLENGARRGCQYDFLEIRNGGYITSPLIGKFCGGVPPPTRIPSSTNTLYLKFHSDNSRSGHGFQLFWDGTSTGCGSTLKGPTGSIVSPNYPSSAGRRMECVWKIVVNHGSAIQIMFADLDLRRTPRCWGEYVEVRDGPRHDSPLIGKYCNPETALAVNSTGSTVRVKFVSRHGTRGRGFHATYTTICNRQIRGFSGVIESPNFPEPYPHNRNCSWDILVTRGNKVNISFSHFAVEDPHRTTENCRFDFVEIKETTQYQKSDPPLVSSLGKFCGTSLPPMVATTKDTAIVHFVSDASFARNGFRLEWVINGCGGRIRSNWGRLTSPNYPRPYPSNVLCEWYIETALGTRASLAIYDLDMEKSSSCVYDSLSVYAGPDDKSALLSQLCHKPERSVLLTAHGNQMFVRFVADSTLTAKGFNAYVSQLPGGCGGMMTAPTGFVYSPNYPSNYDHDDDCSWQIRVDENHVVELTFLDFNVERHINCSYDHVAVYDGRSSSAPLLFLHCGDQLPEPAVIRSTGNTMLVRLKTDGSTSSRGFKANYTTSCGARLGSRNSGTISSPGFPLFIYRLNCTWFITSPRSEDRVTLTFTHMDIQTVSNENCDNDYVEVLDGEDLEAPSIGKYCFNRIPPAITSQGNSLVLRISTLDSWGFGFRANYDVSAGACGGTLTSAEGSFVSPNFPHGYPALSECIWIIKASQGNRVHLSFRRMDIEATDFCNTDFVEVHEEGPSGPLLGHFCGNEIPGNLTAAQKLWVLFRSDENGQAPGFMADYSLIHGNELSGSEGWIESPLFPFPIYSIGTYSWRIVVNQSHAIRIRFFRFDFEFDATTDNCGNYLKIYDGYDENALQLFYACDNTLPSTIYSSGNVVQIVIARSYFRYGSIFKLKWDQVSLELSRNATAIHASGSSNVTGCGGTVDLSLGNRTSLLSPRYSVFPGYPPNIRCEWIITAPPSYRVQLKIEDLDIESHSSCAYDRLDVYDLPYGETGHSNYVLNQTLCQRIQNGTILTSGGRTLKLVFVSDGSVSRPGFNLTLTPLCGGIIRDTRGRITSPNFPQNYAHTSCTWIIRVRSGRTINVVIRTLDIYKGPQLECSTDRLILRNGGHQDSPFLGQGRICGNTIPTLPETTGNQLFIQFNSWTSGGRGFDLVFNEVGIGCGGQIHLTEGAGEFPFSSPNYPNIPPPFTECEWIFTVPQNELVQLDFQLSFQLRWTAGCTVEGVEIRDGGTRVSPIISTLCNTKLPPTHKSTGNIMYVRYYTNSNEPRNGFKAQASIATCGGTVVGRYGSITSPGFPVSYDTNLDCLWTIRGPAGSSLSLDFSDLEIGPARFNPNANRTGENCSRDYVQISEENITDITEPRTWNFCGVKATAVLPERISSSSNQIHVRFRSGTVSGTRKGFRIRYMASTERCGGTIQGEPSGIIMSPSYPRPYPHYRTCIWKVVASPDRRIRLEFLDFDLEERIITPSGTYCADYIKVFQSTEMWGTGRKVYNESLCGTSTPPPVESTSSIMVIRFRTDSSVAHRGFRARFTTDLPSLCGGELSGNFGVLSSPTQRTGTNETAGIFCAWTHAGGEEDNVTTVITIADLRLPPWRDSDISCKDGFLTAHYATASYNWRRYCGRQSNVKLYIPGSAFKIRYEASHWESSFNLTYQVIGCGGLVTTPNQTIMSPNFPTTYATNLECIWKVNFNRGRIQLVITDLDLDNHRNNEGCDRDYLLIRNGLYPSSPVIGKYCGTVAPPSISSMSSGLWIEFHSDENSAENRRGFRIETRLVENGCGGTIHNKRGTLRSPKTSLTFPKYPNNVECEWTIVTVPGYMINFQFTGRFDLETQINCSNDFVQISVEEGVNWNVIGRYCGRQLPGLINTTSTAAKVLFRSNERANGDGFTLNWYSTCGGIFSAKTGVIRSAHYDRLSHSIHANPGTFWARGYVGWENQHRVQKCDYTVQGGSENDYIVLQFQAPFDVSVRSSEGWLTSDTVETCPIVNVTLYEGNATRIRQNPYYYRRLGQFCGTEVPPNAFVGRGALTLVYNYMPYFLTFGFQAEYNIYRCGGEVLEAMSIQSPGHPFTSAPNMNCTWTVQAPPGKVVRFKFDRMELEFNSICNFDYVKLFDGNWANEARKLGTFCGNLTESIHRIISTGNTMTIVFVTDHSIQHSGFKGAVDFTIGYEGQITSSCTSGICESPLQPGLWRRNKMIRLGESSAFLYPPLHHHESYELISGPEGGCGGKFNGSHGGGLTIQSPDSDNDRKYGAYLDCQWLLIGPDFQILDLTFSVFEVEGNRSGTALASDDSCPYDFIEIRDGPSPASELLGKFCGSSLPPQMSSSSNFLWINFVSDGSYQFSGFRATIASRPSPCGLQFVFNASLTPQILKSPSYPANYGPNMRCRWSVDGARRNDEVDIRFLDMDIESSQDCTKDRLQIRDVSFSYTSPEGIGGPILFNGNKPTDWRFRHLNDIDTASILQNFKYCGSQTPSDFVSVGRSAEIVFESDASESGRGFQVEIKAAGCNRTYESSQGRVFSPEWPTHSPFHTNCVKWIRNPNNGTTISIYFNYFLLRESVSCTESFFEVREGSKNGELRGRFCGSSRPNPIFSRTNTLWINYVTKFQLSRGFDFSYTTTTAGIGCGGDLFHTGGSITSPFYPGGSNQDLDCTWRLRVPAGLKINLLFSSFLIGGDCNQNFLEILSMNSHELSAPPTPFTRYCPGDVPSAYNGDTDMAMIRYKSEGNRTEMGWRIQFSGRQVSGFSI